METSRLTSIHGRILKRYLVLGLDDLGPTRVHGDLIVVLGDFLRHICPLTFRSLKRGRWFDVRAAWARPPVIRLIPTQGAKLLTSEC